MEEAKTNPLARRTRSKASSLFQPLAWSSKGRGGPTASGEEQQAGSRLPFVLDGVVMARELGAQQPLRRAKRQASQSVNWGSVEDKKKQLGDIWAGATRNASRDGDWGANLCWWAIGEGRGESGISRWERKC